jgi:hypothetical protein
MYDRPQALDVQWIKCRVNVGKQIVSLYALDVQWIQCRVNVENKLCHCYNVGSMWKKNSVTVIINSDTIFFPHWPYILFIERRVPVDRLMMLCIATTCSQPGHRDLLPDTKFAPLKNIILTVDLLPTEKMGNTCSDTWSRMAVIMA